MGGPEKESIEAKRAICTKYVTYLYENVLVRPITVCNEYMVLFLKRTIIVDILTVAEVLTTQRCKLGASKSSSQKCSSHCQSHSHHRVVCSQA